MAAEKAMSNVNHIFNAVAAFDSELENLSDGEEEEWLSFDDESQEDITDDYHVTFTSRPNTAD